MNYYSKISFVALLSLIILLFSITSCNQTTEPDEIIGYEIGNTAPDFTLLDKNEIEHKLSDYRGKVIYLDFWATWCYPCLEKIPELRTLHEMKNDQDFVLISVSLDYDDGKQLWLKYINENDMEWLQLLDTDGFIQQKYSVSFIPYVYLINKDGKIVQKGHPAEISVFTVDSLIAE